jgi:hypothetical protein
MRNTHMYGVRCKQTVKITDGVYISAYVECIYGANASDHCVLIYAAMHSRMFHRRIYVPHEYTNETNECVAFRYSNN